MKPLKHDSWFVTHSSLVSKLLAAWALVLLLSGAVAAVGLVLARAWAELTVTQAALLAAGMLIAVTLVASLLAGIAWLGAALGRVVETAPRAPRGSRPSPHDAAPRPEGAPPGVDRLARVEAELREINYNLLLTDQQRRAKADRLHTAAAERLSKQAEDAIDAGRFAEADRLLERLFRIVPDEPRWRQLDGRLADARRAAEQEDLATARRQIDQKIASDAYDQAVEIAQDLLDHYPSSPAAMSLLEKVRHRRDEHHVARRRSLHQRAESEADARRWGAALAAVDQLLAEYPDSPEADAARAALPTLRDNARLEEVRRLRDRIRQLLEAHQYASAVDLAERVMREYPDSQAAHDLAAQMDRLRELAAQAKSQSASGK